MKESTLMNMKHDMGKIVEGMHNTIRDLRNMNTLLQGLLETVKRMPGYEEAIAKLLEEQKNESDALEEATIKKVAGQVEEMMKDE
tara:strand:+ start:340 stop:594 length:255 start_codon:yes stop_codon:yes gene_type:complete